MLICKDCQRPWKDVGLQWLRKNKKKYDYRCECGSKHKPVVVDDSINDHKSRYESLSTDKKNIFIDRLDEIRRSRKTYGNILCVGDLHLPFTLEPYLDFCTDIYNKYNCDHVVFLGDLLDNHFSSFHATDPDGVSAADELEFAINKLSKWNEAFPEADVCLGNHDQLILRKMYANGLSKRWVKDFNDVLGVNWNFKPSFIYNGVLFRHGINMKAAPKSGSEMMSVVQGHHHTDSYIHWNVGRGRKVFGVQCPCGVDRESYAMAYAQEHPKQAIGCAVILENGRLPIIEMMDL